MQSVVVYNPRGRDSGWANDAGSGGGDVEDILKRMGNVETTVSDLKSQVSAVLATMPHLATKADVMDVRAAVAELRGEIAAARAEAKADLAAGLGSVRTDLGAELGSVRADLGSLRADMSLLETRIIKWIVATSLTTAGLMFTLTKLVH